MEAYRWAEKNTWRRSDNRDAAIKNINEPTPIIFICQVQVLSVTKVCQKIYTYVIRINRKRQTFMTLKNSLFFLYPQSPAVSVNKEIFKEYGCRGFVSSINVAAPVN